MNKMRDSDISLQDSRISNKVSVHTDQKLQEWGALPYFSG